ncbi:MAG: class I SAM-dependent methyltransferase [Bacteroidota bacterium]
MSKIAYDPVKDRFAAFIKRNRLLRTLFYQLLDLFFLRSWHVRNAVRKQVKESDLEAQSWTLLDAGCGFGQYDRFLLNEFDSLQVKAVDVKQDYLADCRYYFDDQIQKGRIRFEKADLLRFTEQPQYDGAICVDVLEHIEEDVTVMRNVAKSLKEGGFFIMHSPSIYAEEDAGEDEFFVDEHARAGYSKEDLERKLRKAGLEPKEIAYTYGKAGHAAWVMLIKYPMLWFTKWGLAISPLVALYYLVTLLPGLLLMKMDMSGYNPKGTGILALAEKPKL